MPKNARLFEHAENGVIAVTTEAGAANLRGRGGLKILVAPESEGRVCLKSAMQKLGEAGINTVFLEGGSQLNGSMLDHGLVDRVAGFIAPLLLGGQDAVSPIGGRGLDLVGQAQKLRDVGWTPIGTDLLLEGYLWKPADDLGPFEGV